MLIIKILLISTSCFIFFQDLKERQVYWFLFPLFGICSAILFYKNTLPELFYSAISLNLLFVMTLLLVIYLYSRIKLKQKLKETFGLGDGLMFIGLAVTFATVSFLTVFVFALLFALLLHLALKQKSKNKSVPLAGYLSLFFAITYITQWSGFTSSLYIF